MKNHNLKPFAKSERTVDRNAGTPQKTPKNFREAILLVAESLGEDGKGKDGLVGHLRRMAKKHPQSFAALLSHLPPQTATVPVGKVVYQTVDEAAAAVRAYGITPGMIGETMLPTANEKERAELREALDRADAKGLRRHSDQN
jgi:hypothetical protein